MRFLNRDWTSCCDLILLVPAAWDVPRPRPDGELCRCCKLFIWTANSEVWSLQPAAVRVHSSRPAAGRTDDSPANSATGNAPSKHVTVGQWCLEAARGSWNRDSNISAVTNLILVHNAQCNPCFTRNSKRTSSDLTKKTQNIQIINGHNFWKRFIW